MPGALPIIPFLANADPAQQLTELARQAAELGNQAAVSNPQLGLLLAVFMLAIFVGFEIITKVPPTLHTPLMSGSNAISGITIVGALIAAGAAAAIGEEGGDYWRRGFALIAVIMATINVVGGYLVTHRMLGMFKKKG